MASRTERVTRDILVRNAAGFALPRPLPPPQLTEDQDAPPQFLPAPNLVEWLLATFVLPWPARNEAMPLRNPAHEHLAGANIGALWTNAENVTKGRRVWGTAEKPLPPPGVGKWQRARWRQQMREWFPEFDGELPDFIITIDATLAMVTDDLTWCAGCEHELYHCAQALDEYGSPKFTRDERPVFRILGHDAEEFAGVVRRYGVGAAAGGVSELVAAAAKIPLIGRATAELVCGTCGKRAA
jgi:hypothetical protein